MPKILLISPPSNCVSDDRLEPPLGLLYIASSLRARNYNQISIFDMTGCLSESDISKAISSTPDADIYGISCFSTNYQYARKIIKYIKTINPSAYVVIGGSHPSGLSDFTFRDSQADIVVIGEGEDAFCDLVNTFLKGLLITGIVQGKTRKDIDSYPFPDRDIVNYSTYSRTIMGQRVVSLISSRGCVHHCIHCNSVVMGGGSRNARYRSSDNIIEEIKTLRDSFIYYRFNDDHFTGNPNLEELLIKMKQLDIKFRIFARIEDLDKKTCGLLKEAGCVHVSIGLESLHPANLRVIGKASQIGKENNVKIAKDHGLIVRSSFLVGLPYDNDRTINDSFKEASQLGIDEFAVYPLIPYPGTEIWKNPGRYGYTIINSNFTDYVQMGKDGKTCYALRHKNFRPDDVRKWRKTATAILETGGSKHMSESKIAG